jgi:hypothetical protein
MSRRYEFAVDGEARAFCDEIIDDMIRKFGIAESEALGRVNRQWKNNGFKDGDVRYHETAEFWASNIYFGADSQWWNSPQGLSPLSFP